MRYAVFGGDTLSLFISLIVFCWAQLVFLGPWTKPLRPRWQTATLTGHGVWAHMLFVALSLRAVPPKKDAASWGPRLVRSPLIPLLRPKQQLARLERGHRRTHTQPLQHDRLGEIWFRLDLAFVIRIFWLDPVRPNTFVEQDHLAWTLMSVDLQQPNGGPCLLSEPLTPHGCFVLGSRLNRMHLKNRRVST